MEKWSGIRFQHEREGISKREILRETGMHWTTLEKILAHSEPPGYRMSQARPKPKIGPYLGRIEEILKQDKEVLKKQRHTAKRIFERIGEEGYTGGYTAVKDLVRELKRYSKEVFVPLIHRPGEAQVDFGYALANVAGKLRKIAFFAMSLPYSDAFFVMAFDRECTETFWEGHVRAFEFFGGVPTRIRYDNSRVMVSKILENRNRRLTDGFLKLKSHYLFDHQFCRIRRGNEKGVVEGVVGYARRNFLVPVPQVRDLAELNEHLLGCCQRDLSRRVRGQTARKSELLAADQAAFLPLPEVPFEACRKASTISNSLSLVRFDNNDYSVPVRYAHHPIVIKGYFERVELCHQDQVVAIHQRIWEKERVSFEPIHYLSLLERKPSAFDYARPLEGWDLPECFSVLRRRLETEQGGEGTREYIRVLRLLEKHSLRMLKRAIEKALAVRAHSRDAIAQFIWPREEWRTRTFSLDGRDHLRHLRVERPDVRSYNILREGGARV
jgi:transposase|tara:strand:- start:878 stop:2368 length:1491 start_codon:yes stop_codon:yes gene_type:complete